MRHIRIHRHCGACTAYFQQGDKVVTLRSNINKTISHALKPVQFCHFEFKKNSKQDKEEYRHFCDVEDCEVCARVLETASIHAYCFQLFTQNCTSKDKHWLLWMVSTRRKPWREARFRMLAESRYTPGALGTVATACGMIPQWGVLPTELAEKIWQDSCLHVVWRYSSSVMLAKELASLTEQDEKDDHIEIPLNKVGDWRRGQRYRTCDTIASPDSLIRITIDARGISRIETFPPGCVERAHENKHLLFIVKRVDDLQSVNAEIKMGLCRLSPEAANAHLQVWDSSTQSGWPENITTCTARQLSYPRYATVETDPASCIGLTFFIKGTSFVAIHCHTAKEPDAVETFRSIPSTNSVSWFHVPLTRGDEIVGVGFPRQETFTENNPPHLLLKLRQSGYTKIGFKGRYENWGQYLYKTQPSPTLLYGVSNETINFAGVYPTTDNGRLKILSATDKPLHYGNSITSIASLEGLVSTQTFYTKHGSYFKGIILEYRNGTKRALGECRTGLDAVQHIKDPSSICITKTTPEGSPATSLCLQQWKLEFNADVNHTHVKEDGCNWKCDRMRGALEVCFNRTHSVLQIHSEPATKL